jgi:nitrite reductase/ring-hydroxylating ferredoxin subunit
MALTPVAVYERTVRASLERVWENVLDWAHLPWLHSSTFAHVRLEARTVDGWRAESALRSDPGRPFVVEVAIDRPALLYHTRTVAGAGAGTDIVTRLAPHGEHTRVAVEFLVPDVPDAAVSAVGSLYRRLYARLWDEDEAMMIRRQAVVDGTLRRTWRTVEAEGFAVTHAAVCPHLGGPLDGAVVRDGCIVCPWHGYRFELRSGRQIGGPLVLDVSPAVSRAARRR